jgi:hypothetical protein
MSQDMGDKIRQISEMLNSPEAQEGIRHLFGSLGTNRGTMSAETDSRISEAETETPQSSSLPQSIQETDWVNYIQSMFSQMNNVQDSRVNLLRSVHPFLNPTRRERCATCMNIMKVANILRAMTNSNGRLL